METSSELTRANTTSIQEEEKEESKILNEDPISKLDQQVAQSRAAMSDLDRQFLEFQERFANLNKLMAEKIAISFGLGMKGEADYTHKPKTVTSLEAAKYLLGKKQIAVLTGAGLSAASGIPTFRGANGFWSKSYGGETDATVILTTSYFEQNPQLNWQWHYDFNEISEKGKPNQGHQAILKFQEYCAKQRDIDAFLITQNIDDYHSQLIRNSKILMSNTQKQPEGTKNFAFTPHVYDIHGNLRYMHCSNEELSCSEKFYKTPSLEEVKDRSDHVPICKECGANMKPHCMFFDESYNEKYYRYETVKNFVEQKMDCLIVVGTALATSFARTIVFKALDKIECPVIEINMESCIDKGFNLKVLEKSEVALDKLFPEFYRLKQNKSHLVQQKGPQVTTQVKTNKGSHTQNVNKNLKPTTQTSTVKSPSQFHKSGNVQEKKSQVPIGNASKSNVIKSKKVTAPKEETKDQI